MTALELHERRRLDVCEERIRRGLATFVDVGRALTEIRNDRLYRQTHDTFEAYCQEQWSLSRPRAYQLIEAADVSTTVDIQNEAQARELGRVPEEDRADVWHEANERTGGKPTAAAIRDTRRERLEPVPRGCSTCGGTDDHLPDCAQLPRTPRAQDELPPEDDQVGAGLTAAVEEQGAPAPSAATPNEGVSELLDSDTDLQRERYLHEFIKVLNRSDDFMEFDADKLGDLADADVARTLDDYLTNVKAFVDRFHRAQRGLRVISGGKA